jgi:hypothetical protein
VEFKIESKIVSLLKIVGRGGVATLAIGSYRRLRAETPPSLRPVAEC